MSDPKVYSIEEIEKMTPDEKDKAGIITLESGTYRQQLSLKNGNPETVYITRGSVALDIADMDPEDKIVFPFSNDNPKDKDFACLAENTNITGRPEDRTVYAVEELRAKHQIAALKLLFPQTFPVENWDPEQKIKQKESFGVLERDGKTYMAALIEAEKDYGMGIHNLLAMRGVTVLDVDSVPAPLRAENPQIREAECKEGKATFSLMR